MSASEVNDGNGEEQAGPEPAEVLFTLPEIGELFHRVSSVIPEEQEVATIPPTLSVSEALELMLEGGFSQLPVVAGGTVLGVFSYGAAMRKLALSPPPGDVPTAKVPVEELMDPAAFVRAQDELADVIGEFERVDALLVGDEDNLQGIVTAVDVARFYALLAKPFVLLSEIERTLRALVSVSVDAATIEARARVVFADAYRDRSDDPPTLVDSMSLGELVRLVIDGRFWSELNGGLGVRRDHAAAKLRPIPDLRNNAFHFRRNLETEELDNLQDARDWLLRLRLATEDPV